MTDQPTAGIGTLEYAKRTPFRRRTWLRRGIIFAIVLASAAAWHWGHDLRDRIVLLYRQHACLAYAAPPEQVVFDSNPARVAILARDRNYAIVKGCAFRMPPAQWDRYFAAVGNSATSVNAQRAILFLHECRSPNGIRFMVELERTGGANASAYFLQGYDVESNVVRPAGATHSAVYCPENFDVDVSDIISATDIRIYAGQPDPSDPSHFTIRYESGGKIATASGRVDNNGHLSLTHAIGW